MPLSQGIDLHWCHVVDEPQHHTCKDECPGTGREHRNALLDKERTAAEQQSVGTRWVPGFRRKCPKQDRASQSTHTVHAPHIEGVRECELVFYPDGTIAAYRSRD